MIARKQKMANEKRLIDANALLLEIEEELANKSPFFTHEQNEMIDCGLRIALHDIMHQPTVDAVEVVHGRWIDNIDENGYLRNAWRKCSACGGLNYSKKPPYCPHCGAKMDGDGNG